MHGWGADLRAFSFLADYLVNNKCVFIDFYGHGASPDIDRPMRLKDFSDGVIEVLFKEKIENAVFVGHSFGGRVAMDIASHNGIYVNRLVLIDSAGILPRRGPKYFFRVGLHKFLKRFGIGLKGSADYARLSDAGKATFINIVNYDQRPFLHKIKCPTAIFWGDRDKDTPMYMAKILNKNISDSALFTLTNAGHFSYLDNKGFLPVFLKFVEG